MQMRFGYQLCVSERERSALFRARACACVYYSAVSVSRSVVCARILLLGILIIYNRAKEQTKCDAMQTLASYLFQLLFKKKRKKAIEKLQKRCIQARRKKTRL